MDLKGQRAYDSQVASLAAYRKVHFTEKEIVQILDMIDCHTKLRSESLEKHSVCNQWSMTISPDNSFSEAEAAAAQSVPCQVVDFIAKKAAMNRECKENIELKRPAENQEVELRNHFSVVDQKLRYCVQQKRRKSLWDRTADTFSRVLKKFIKVED